MKLAGIGSSTAQPIKAREASQGDGSPDSDSTPANGSGREASIASRLPVYLVVVIFTVLMYYFFARDGPQYAVLSVVAGAFFGYVMYHFDIEYQSWRRETATASFS
ncbi:MAG: hypothetical protein JRN21_03485 [Nitrososphaerota archaeon]|nr:hypothetical protein [Nitrososphaerota archaeon]